MTTTLAELKQLLTQALWLLDQLGEEPGGTDPLERFLAVVAPSAERILGERNDYTEDDLIDLFALTGGDAQTVVGFFRLQRTWNIERPASHARAIFTRHGVDKVRSWVTPGKKPKGKTTPKPTPSATEEEDQAILTYLGERYDD